MRARILVAYAIGTATVVMLGGGELALVVFLWIMVMGEAVRLRLEGVRHPFFVDVERHENEVGIYVYRRWLAVPFPPSAAHHDEWGGMFNRTDPWVLVGTFHPSEDEDIMAERISDAKDLAARWTREVKSGDDVDRAVRIARKVARR